MTDIHRDFVHFVRLVVDRSGGDAAMVGRRLLRQVIKDRPDLEEMARPLLAGLSTGVLRRADTRPREAEPIPVDSDSRLELVRRHGPRNGDAATWPESVQNVLDRVVRERERAAELVAAGVPPSRSLLFVGPPGVGKTHAAHEIATRLGLDLLVLDLAAVMSSFLGRTGNNIRTVLDFAARGGNVLLLDEFDAIAKRRDDSSDVGELRRLVNVLLQTIDDWPGHGLLIAATNHPELLDPAVWRRFDSVVTFPKPDSRAVHSALAQLLRDQPAQIVDVAARLLDGSSYAEITRELTTARRESILTGLPLEDCLVTAMQERVRLLPMRERLGMANALTAAGHSQRRVHDVTGLSRDTIRKHRSRRNRDGS